MLYFLFFFNDTATTEIYTLSLHDALPISATSRQNTKDQVYAQNEMLAYQQKESTARVDKQASHFVHIDRKSGSAGMPRPISYAVFCLKKKKADMPIMRRWVPIRLHGCVTR